MPDTRSHRGPHPEDARLFAAVNLSALQEAVRHFSWLLTALFREFDESRALPWSVEVTPNPDAVLIRSPHVVVSADSAILDRCDLWCIYAPELVERAIPNGWVVERCPLL